MHRFQHIALICLLPCLICQAVFAGAVPSHLCFNSSDRFVDLSVECFQGNADSCCGDQSTKNSDFSKIQSHCSVCQAFRIDSGGSTILVQNERGKLKAPVLSTEGLSENSCSLKGRDTHFDLRLSSTSQSPPNSTLQHFRDTIALRI